MQPQSTEQSLLNFFLAISVMVLSVFFVMAITGEQSKEEDGKLLRVWLADVRAIAAVQPERFASYNMDTLQCMLHREAFSLGKNEAILLPVACQVNRMDGGQVDFSKEFMKVLIDTRGEQAAATTKTP